MMSGIGCHKVCNYHNISSNSKVTCPPPTTLRPCDGGTFWLIMCVENEIAGDVLVHLDHDALKDLDVTSVGHRLYLLKQIYNLKIAHGVKFEKDDYVPICNAPTVSYKD